MPKKRENQLSAEKTQLEEKLGSLRDIEDKGKSAGLEWQNREKQLLEEKTQLEDQLAGMRQTAGDQAQQLEASTSELEAVQSQVEAVRSELEAEKSRIEAEKSQLEAEKSQLEVQKSTLEEQLSHLQESTGEEAKEKEQQLQAANAQLEEKLSNLEARVCREREDAEQELNSVRKECSGLRADLAAASEAEAKAQEEASSSLEQERSRWLKEREDLCAQLAKAAKISHQEQGDVKGSNEVPTETPRPELRARAEGAVQETTTWRRMVIEEQERNSELQEQLANANKEIRDARKAEREARKAAKGSPSKNSPNADALQAECERLRSQLAAVKAEKGNQPEPGTESTSKEYDNVRSENAAAVEANATLQAKLEEVTAEVQKQKKLLTRAQQESTKAAEELNLERKQNSRLRQECEKLRNSGCFAAFKKKNS